MSETELVCERCGRVLRPWPLKRADLCSPKEWVYCIRQLDRVSEPRTQLVEEPRTHQTAEPETQL